MGDALDKARIQLNEFWQGRSKAQKIKIGLSAIILLLSLSILVVFTSRPEMVPLYKELDIKDAGAITKKLDEMKIKWKTGSTETEILVPKEDVNRLRMQLATEGLPRNGFSLVEALDNTKLGTTDMERRERIRLGQEYAIADAIETIEGVEYCQVNLYIPEDSLFVLSSKSYESSAGIIVKLEPGVELTQNQIDGIIQFVSKSVKGLRSENISIIDQTGKELTSLFATEQGILLKQMEIEQNAQEKLQRSIREFLETAYGKNNVDVRVNLKLDFDSKITNIIKFEPPVPGETSGLIASMQELEEHAVNGGNGGIPGTDTNSGENINYAEVESQQSKYDKVSRVVNYELNQIKEEIVKAQGQVRSLSVAVLINSTALAKELTQQDKQSISYIVSAAAGIDSGLVEIQSLPFDTKLADAISKGFEDRQRLERIKLLTSVGAAVLLIAGLITSVVILRRRKDRRDDLIMAGQKQAVVTEDLGEITLEQEQNAARKQVEKFIQRKPETAAQLLKTWLSEE
ncbi:MAG: flagellar basal-body MS-ring/collar protein FliF [Bacillota bacterium]|nr:flagellar basal-body MS-ring/collar protein FliF [Bacillota bacterium]